MTLLVRKLLAAEGIADPLAEPITPAAGDSPSTSRSVSTPNATAALTALQVPAVS